MSNLSAAAAYRRRRPRLIVRWRYFSIGLLRRCVAKSRDCTCANKDRLTTRVSITLGVIGIFDAVKSID